MAYDERAGALTIQDFPVEVVDHIFGCMRDDKAALSACTLLSQSWRDLGRPHLFSCIQTPAPQINDYADFLESSPHLVALIKQVLIVNKAARPPYRFAQTAFRTETDLYSPLVRLLSNLPALLCLHFRNVCFTAPPAESSSYEPFKLRRLTLERCWAEDPRFNAPAIFSVLSLFEAEALVIFDPSFRARTGFETISAPRPLVYRSLDLRPLDNSEGYSVALDAARQTLLPGCLRVINVDCSDWDHVRRLGALLRDVGKNLEHLKLDIMSMALLDDEDDEPDWGQLSLVSCPKLETLSFTMPFGDYRFGSPGLFSSVALAAILTQASCTLREASVTLIRMGGSQPSDLADVTDLPGIQLVLTRRAFPNLQKFIFYFAEWENLEDYRPTLESTFPELHRRGVLRLETYMGGSENL